MNDEGRLHSAPATNTIIAADDSSGSGHVPSIEIRLPYEGSMTAVLRGCKGWDQLAFRAWIASDPELAELCRLARRIRDRRAS